MIILNTVCNLFISMAYLCIVLDIFCLFLIVNILYYKHSVCPVLTALFPLMHLLSLVLLMQ
jgi:hypothetical protein